LASSRVYKQHPINVRSERGTRHWAVTIDVTWQEAGTEKRLSIGPYFPFTTPSEAEDWGIDVAIGWIDSGKPEMF
jgi:hypothetical protein